MLPADHEATNKEALTRGAAPNNGPGHPSYGSSASADSVPDGTAPVKATEGHAGLPCRARPAWGAQRNTPLSEIIPSHRSAERLPPRRGRDRESGQPRERTGSEKAADLSGRLTDGNQARRAESSDSRATTAFANVLERTSGEEASPSSLVSAAYRLPDNG